MRKHVIYIIAATILPLTALLLLNSLYVAPIGAKNGFSRKFNSLKLQMINSCKNAEGTWKFAGNSSGSFYFNSKDPDLIIKTSYNLTNKEVIKLPKQNTTKNESGFVTYVDSSYIYVFSGNVPHIIRFNVNNSKLDIVKPELRFSKGVPISKNTFIVRTLDPSDESQYFTKTDILGEYLAKDDKLTNRVSDAGFSTDGILHFNEFDKRIYYTQFYSNTFICADTNLNLVYKGKTIDTLDHYKVKTRLNIDGKGKSITFSAPPRMINGVSYVWKNNLYIRSNIKADNENQAAFAQNAVIDVYDLSRGNYVNSFYIPNYLSEQLLNFSIRDGVVIAIYKSSIVTYHIINK